MSRSFSKTGSHLPGMALDAKPILEPSERYALLIAPAGSGRTTGFAALLLDRLAGCRGDDDQHNNRGDQP